MLELKLLNPTSTALAIEQFLESNGIIAIIKIMKKMMTDEMVHKHAVPVIELLTASVAIITDFIQYGGIDLLNKIGRMFEKDDFLSLAVPKLLKIVLAIGAKAAIVEIRNEATNLQLCQKCQEAVERSKRMHNNNTTDAIKIPRSADRMGRVLMFMESYPDREDVQCAALDAIITFARNTDAETTIMETALLQNVAMTLKKNGKVESIFWRVCMALSIMCLFNSDIAHEISKLDLHETVASSYVLFENEPRVQQQILWMLSSYLAFPKSYRKIHTSAVCINLFQGVLGRRDELVKAKMYSAKVRNPRIDCICGSRLGGGCVVYICSV